MVKIIKALMAAIIITAVTACSVVSPAPEADVEKFSELLQDAEYSEAEQYCSSDAVDEYRDAMSRYEHFEKFEILNAEYDSASETWHFLTMGKAVQAGEEYSKNLIDVTFDIVLQKYEAGWKIVEILDSLG